MIKSIVKSLRIIPTEGVLYVKGTVNLLDMPTLAKMNLQELGNLSIRQVQWNVYSTLGFTLSDGQTCRAGTSWDFVNSHVFDQSKKITKIVTTVHWNEVDIAQIKFWSAQELLCTVGYPDDGKEPWGGRVVSFEIAADEQLIGCELEHGNQDYRGKGDYFKGVTWLKWKIN